MKYLLLLCMLPLSGCAAGMAFVDGFNESLQASKTQKQNLNCTGVKDQASEYYYINCQ